MSNALSHLTGAGTRVAVVDSGIDFSHPKIGGAPSGVRLKQVSAGQVVECEDLSDNIGHGTACAGIIRKKAPESSLVSVRIFDESLQTDGYSLVAAIGWAAARGIDVVNLSLGTTDLWFRDVLFDACHHAVKVGIIIVAADHNERQESLPAVFSNVIGVAAGRFADPLGYRYRPLHRIECVAHGDMQRVCWLNSGELFVGGTSYAAAHISGIVARIREAHPGCPLVEVRRILRRHSIEETGGMVSEPVRVPPKISDIHRATRPGDKVCSQLQPRKAALYPYNKEMHAFVRFPELLDFEVVGVADPLGKGLVGQDAGTAIGIDPTGVRIAARLADALAGADTLILGYVDELGRIAGRDVLRESIQLALDHGLNVFSFLPVRREEYEELHRMARLQNLKIACPSVSFDAIREMLVTPLKYGPVQMPVLAVLGTGPQQGKFTLQLSLRRSLLHKGYKVGQLGTEHHSALFGFDSTFPMGYASPLELPVQLFGPYLDFQMREIAHTTNPDILLAGAQSGTVPYNVGDPNTHTLASLAFLFGIKPDACVLVVNSIDSYTYIGDTIEAIRALSKAPVISLAMSDREKDVQTAYGRSWIQPRLLTDTEISKRLRDLENRFSIPAHQISSPQDQTKLTETVVDYFARTSSEDPCQTEAA